MFSLLTATLVRRVRNTAPLTLAMTAFGAMVAVVAALVFAAVSEDVVQTKGAATVDGSRLGWIAHHRSDALVSGSRVLNDAGAVGVVVVLAVAASAWLWWRRVPLGAALAPMSAVASAGAIAAVLKVLVDRSRPPAVYRLLTETDPSFPSGHATGSMALGISAAVVVAVYVLRRPLSRLVVLAIGVALPIVVGASRLELGVHWPTDVIAGLALGATVAFATTAACLWLAARTDSRPTSDGAPGRVSRASALLRSVRGSNGSIRLAAASGSRILRGAS